jgi:hypothetical protein
LFLAAMLNTLSTNKQLKLSASTLPDVLIASVAAYLELHDFAWTACTSRGWHHALSQPCREIGFSLSLSHNLPRAPGCVATHVRDLFVVQSTKVDLDAALAAMPQLLQLRVSDLDLHDDIVWPAKLHTVSVFNCDGLNVSTSVLALSRVTNLQSLSIDSRCAGRAVLSLRNLPFFTHIDTTYFSDAEFVSALTRMPSLQRVSLGEVQASGLKEITEAAGMIAWHALRVRTSDGDALVAAVHTLPCLTELDAACPESVLSALFDATMCQLTTLFWAQHFLAEHVQLESVLTSSARCVQLRSLTISLLRSRSEVAATVHTSVQLRECLAALPQLTALALIRIHGVIDLDFLALPHLVHTLQKLQLQTLDVRDRVAGIAHILNLQTLYSLELWRVFDEKRGTEEAFLEALRARGKAPLRNLHID